MRCLVYVLFFISPTVFTQILLFNGTIIDQVTKEPVAYAHVKIENTELGASTSEKGDFALVIEEQLLTSKVVVSCLNYETAYVKANELYEKSFELQPKIEKLPEIVIGNYEPTEITIGSTKGKIEALHLHRRDTTAVAQYIKIKGIDSSVTYLKKISFKLKEKVTYPSVARLRIMDKNPVDGSPRNDLLTKSVIIKIYRKKNNYSFDISELYIEAPADGFFVGIEKFIIPMNRCFEAPIERSTYPRYVATFKDKIRSKEVDESELLSFEKYREEVTAYEPSVNLIKKTSKHTNQYGHLYSLNSGTWEVYDENLIIPIEVVLSN